MKKPHYSWWGYVRAVVQAYPGRRHMELSGVALREREAVQAAIEAAERMPDGASRMKAVRLIHWGERARALQWVANAIPCDRSTVARWQRRFFEEVARNLDLLD